MTTGKQHQCLNIISKEMLPDYEQAAAELKPEGIVLAKIDSIKNRKLADKEDVHSYPVMKFIT